MLSLVGVVEELKSDKDGKGRGNGLRRGCLDVGRSGVSDRIKRSWGVKRIIKVFLYLDLIY